jgi:hypothetical protein
MCTTEFHELVIKHLFSSLKNQYRVRLYVGAVSDAIKAFMAVDSESWLGLSVQTERV